MLEVMDVRDQGSSATPRTQEHVSPVPSPSQVISKQPPAQTCCVHDAACLQETPGSEGEDDARSGAGDDQGGHWPGQRACHTHERAVPIRDTVEALDMAEEGKTAPHKSNAARVKVKTGNCGWFRCGDAALLLGAAPPEVRGAPPPNAVRL